MMIRQSRRFRPLSLFSSVSFWTVGLLTAAWIGALWFVGAEHSVWKAAPLAAVLALTVAAGITWQQSRARAARRLQAALAAHARREIWEHRRRIVRLPRNLP
jgi:hypothetical protein